MKAMRVGTKSEREPESQCAREYAREREGREERLQSAGGEGKFAGDKVCVLPRFSSS